MRLDIDHIAVRTSDPESSRDFYVHVLGATVVQLDRGRCGVRFGNVQFHLHGSVSTPDPLPEEIPLPGSLDVCFVWSGTPESAMEHLRANGVEPEIGPVSRRGAHGAGASVYFRDLDGNLLELITYDLPK